MRNYLFAAALLSLASLVGCHREYVNGRLITSYSIEATSEAERDLIVDDFQKFLGKLGLKKSKSSGSQTAGFHSQGETTELWEAANGTYGITISENPYPQYLSGDVSWNFRGSIADWTILEGDLQKLQSEVVDWFQNRPDVLHKESSYWDGSTEF